jgi:hypothetical protein
VSSTQRLAIGRLANAVAAAATLTLAACAGAPSIPDGATLIAQVVYTAGSDEAMHGFHYEAQPDDALNGVLPHSDNVPPATQLIAGCGADTVPARKFALVRFYYYQVGRSGRLDQYSLLATVDDGLQVERGNLVEVEKRLGHGKSRCVIVKRVRARTPAGAGCVYQRDQQGAGFAAMDMISGQSSTSLTCPFFRQEGWKATPVGVIGGQVWWRPPADEQ